MRRKFNAQGTLEDTHGAIRWSCARSPAISTLRSSTYRLTEDFVRAAGPEGSRSSTFGSLPAIRCTPTAIRTTRISPCSARPVSPDSPRRQSRAVVFRFANSCATWTPRRAGARDPAMAGGRTRCAGLVARRPAGDHALHRAEIGGHRCGDAGLSGRRLRASRVGERGNERRALVEHARCVGVRRTLPARPALPSPHDAHRRPPRRASRSRPRADWGIDRPRSASWALRRVDTWPRPPPRNGLSAIATLTRSNAFRRAPISRYSCIRSSRWPRRTRTRAHAATSSASNRTISWSALPRRASRHPRNLADLYRRHQRRRDGSGSEFLDVLRRAASGWGARRTPPARDWAPRFRVGSRRAGVGDVGRACEAWLRRRGWGR